MSFQTHFHTLLASLPPLGRVEWLLFVIGTQHHRGTGGEGWRVADLLCGTLWILVRKPFGTRHRAFGFANDDHVPSGQRKTRRRVAGCRGFVRVFGGGVLGVERGGYFAAGGALLTGANGGGKGRTRNDRRGLFGSGRRYFGDFFPRLLRLAARSGCRRERISDGGPRPDWIRDSGRT